MTPQNNIPDSGRKKIKKSVWLPTLLLLYLAGMTIWFAPSLIEQGEIARLVIVTLIELAIIFTLRYLLRRREEKEKE